MVSSLASGSLRDIPIFPDGLHPSHMGLSYHTPGGIPLPWEANDDIGEGQVLRSLRFCLTVGVVSHKINRILKLVLRSCEWIRISRGTHRREGFRKVKFLVSYDSVAEKGTLPGR